jgi:hypothetical protein
MAGKFLGVVSVLTILSVPRMKAALQLTINLNARSNPALRGQKHLKKFSKSSLKMLDQK